MVKKVIPVQNGDIQGALAGFLRAMLAREDIDMIFTPMRTQNRAVAHAFVADPDILAQADPLAPVLPVNGAAQLARLTVREPRKRIAAVLRPCELRAFVELVKLKQASFEGVTVIGMDCLGTYPVPDFMADHIGRIPEGVESGELTPETGYRFRDACAMCEQPTPGAGAAIKLELIGADPYAGVPVILSESFADLPGLADGREVPARAAAVERLVAARIEHRDANFAEIKEKMQSDDGLGDIFSACIHCMNCQQVCPICYCKVCVFRGQIFDHPPEKYTAWAERKGALRMPSGNMLFHLTRLTHMAVNCVGCGMCTEACPSELPVGRVFRTVGADVQAVFEYLPGQNIEEPLPLVTFREDEWNEVGEE